MENCKKSNRPSSFFMQDPDDIFAVMKLDEGNVFVDLGCGAGDYSIKASDIVSDNGKVYSFDFNKDSVNALNKDLAEKRISNISVAFADITDHIPIADSIADVCLIATVLHALPKASLTNVAKEAYRIMSPKGQLLTLDCSKENLTIGPPKEMRLEPYEIIEVMTKVGFVFKSEKFLGFNYLLSFEKNETY